MKIRSAVSKFYMLTDRRMKPFYLELLRNTTASERAKGSMQMPVFSLPVDVICWYRYISDSKQMLLLQWRYSPYRTLASSILSLQDSPFSYPRHILRFQNSTFLWGEVVSPTPNPNLKEQTRTSRFVWIITFDLSGMTVPASSYATASLALGIIF